MAGETAWADYQPSVLPYVLRGLGIEAEGRDLNSGGLTCGGTTFRLYAFGGGAIYKVQHFKWIHPYGKYLISLGNIDWDNPNPKFRHETRTVTVPGLGLECRIARGFSARADYEYQFWPDIAKFRPNSTHILDPQGFTLGVMFDFSHQRRH
jgi:hypothetical protein